MVASSKLIDEALGRVQPTPADRRMAELLTADLFAMAAMRAELLTGRAARPEQVILLAAIGLLDLVTESIGLAVAQERSAVQAAIAAAVAE